MTSHVNHALSDFSPKLQISNSKFSTHSKRHNCQPQFLKLFSLLVNLRVSFRLITWLTSFIMEQADCV